MISLLISLFWILKGREMCEDRTDRLLTMKADMLFIDSDLSQ